ncbi:DNA cytosine methyltransferase [Ureaplasma parvum]|uniref:DNA cytosine methyltransferase n=1 Tax=Ureaplasma parvum TaxID=134821 RepID=UPI003977BD28
MSSSFLFLIYLKELENIRYESKYEILNAMDFGIPQKRRGYLLFHVLEQMNFLLINLREKKLDY